MSGSAFELAHGPDGLRRVEAAWRSLWAADPQATPFQAPDWAIPWADIFQPDSCLAALLHRQGTPVALLPLFRLEGRLLPLGAGISDWLGPVCAPSAGPGDLTTLLAGIVERLAPSALELPQLVPGGPLDAALPPPGWRLERGVGEPCPAAALPALLSRSLRQNLRTARNRLDRSGRVEIGAVPPPKVPDALERLFELHGTRWAQEGGGVLAEGDVRRFHRAAAPRLAAAGLLRLFTLSVDGQVAGVLHGLCARGRFHYYIAGHDPALEAMSPGSLLIAHAMADATAEGCHLFDFLRGREPYKYRWGATDRPAGWLRLTPA